MMKSVTTISSEYDLAVTVLVGQTMQAELYLTRSEMKGDLTPIIGAPSKLRGYNTNKSKSHTRTSCPLHTQTSYRNENGVFPSGASFWSHRAVVNRGILLTCYTLFFQVDLTSHY
ncbi:hypothetical protein E2C01_011495 [Portunus trituberculatus]|uniref:Uncharacterized protein n=1 Tax=Portunus trituberculatus TaxID=210409 RepID=A0A5B7DBL2_PORTR|nr:hypothetical protein [Portunus trituberculatus]